MSLITQTARSFTAVCLIGAIGMAASALAQPAKPAPTAVPAPGATPAPNTIPAPTATPGATPAPTFQPPPSSLPNALDIKDPQFDWGDISDTDPAEHSFDFKNVSDKTITIAVAASCGCTVAGLEKNTYAPAETGKITARFDPHGKNGPQTKTLTMTVTNPQGVFAQQVMELKSNVKALVTLDPPKMFLSEVDHRNGQTSKIAVTGRKADFKVTKVESASEYVKATLGEATTVDVPSAVPGGPSEKLIKYDITLDVGKGAPLGNLTAQLTITTNDEKAKIPVYFLGADVVGDVKAQPPQMMVQNVNTTSTPFTTQMRLDSRSASQFNITSIDIEGRQDMNLVADAVRTENYYMITLSGVTPSDAGVVQGTLVIMTDSQGGETIRVPFTAAVRKPDAPMPPAASFPAPAGAAPGTPVVKPSGH